jgi:hypothetical protein
MYPRFQITFILLAYFNYTAKMAVFTVFGISCGYVGEMLCLSLGLLFTLNDPVKEDG